MKPLELFNLMLVTVAVTIFVFFRCKSIFQEENQPSQNHVASEQRQKHPLDAPEEHTEQHLQHTDKPMGQPPFRFRATQPVQLVISFRGQSKDDEVCDLSILPYGATVRDAHPSALEGFDGLLEPFLRYRYLEELSLPRLSQQGLHHCVHLFVSFPRTLSHNQAEERAR